MGGPGRVALVPLLAALAGCGAELSSQGPGDAAGGGPDGGGGATDAPPADAAVDAPRCGGRVVYLNFEGQALTDDAASDATQNRASWMQRATGTAPPFRAGDGNRAAAIATITDGIRQILSSYPITVVTQRPAAGPYVMIVFGGGADDVGSAFSLAVNELDCDDSEKSDVIWISNAPGVPLQRVINVAVGGIGFGLGLTATTDPNDCMCGWANTCLPTAQQPCTLSMSIARDQGALQLCPGAGGSQNEQLAFEQAFCQ